MPRSLLAVVLCTCASMTVLAQVRYRPSETGPWRPWSFTAVASTRQTSGASTAEVQAFEARLKAFAEIIKTAPGVSPPTGFAGEIWGNLTGHDARPGRPAGRTVPLAGGVTFAAFPLVEYQRNGKTVNEDLKGGETETLQISVNRIDGYLYGDTIPDGLGDADVFVEPQSGAAIAGLPRFGDALIVRKNQKPLWAAFPIGDTLQPIAARRREEYEQRRDTYTRDVAEFTDWKTPAKRAARRAEWKTSAASMPAAQGAQFVAMMEKNEPQIEAMKETDLAPGGPADKAVRALQQQFEEVDSVLSALSPDARKAAACYDHRASRFADKYRLLAGAPATCRALVRPNFDYFDPRLPRSAPQVMMITQFATRCFRSDVDTSTVRGGCVINRALVDTMDWNAVRAWLDK